MKKVIKDRPRAGALRRYSVAEAKAGLSAILRVSDHRPTLVHRRGHDVAVILSVDEYERLAAREPEDGMAGFLAKVEELKTKHGGGVDFEPGRASLRMQPASFARGKARR